MSIRTVPVTPFTDQVPGTSGLRKKVRVFQRPHYLETFVQAVLEAAELPQGAALVVGGDGRFHNDVAIQVILRMLAAHGVRRVWVGRNGWLSTPAASHLIRLHGAAGGIVLSASHNPGGPDGDFGVKYNVANGGPAPERVTAAIAERARRLEAYRIADAAPVPLHEEGTHRVGDTEVVVVDPVRDYAALMERLFDFDAIRRLFAGGFRMRYDAMHAITGPYAAEILEGRLGAERGTVVNATPLPDFGGGHPDPNLTYAADLVAALSASDAPDFGAASDGDGDRNMILGRGCFVNPSDSLALLAANATCAPGYARGLAGVARSMPTSAAVDRVAESLGVRHYATPTGWKYFGSLLDAGLVTLCGEESFGTGSDHVREKDGLWAVLFWLNVLAARGTGVRALVEAHWRRYGRDYYARHDYEALPADAAAEVLREARARGRELAGHEVAGERVEGAEDFSYTDPVDGSTATNQGLVVRFASGARAVFRLSGTGTEGATVRLYLERPEPPEGRHDLPVADALRSVAEAALTLSRLPELTGRVGPDVVT